jgi:predicted Zn-dependent protease with MMP-like domain
MTLKLNKSISRQCHSKDHQQIRDRNMAQKALSRHEIVMTYTTAPSLDDLIVMARSILSDLPDELAQKCEELGLEFDEFPDEALEQEQGLETPYELLALFRKGSEIAPGVQKKVANNDDVLLLFRRPILDLWCETGDDLYALMREVIIEEIARNYEFPDSDIKAMIKAAAY